MTDKKDVSIRLPLIIYIDDSGQESTPVWALTGPFQHHITGDVGFAFWKYYQVTKDKNWLNY